MNTIINPLFWSFILPLAGFICSGLLSLTAQKKIVPYIACFFITLSLIPTSLLFVSFLTCSSCIPLTLTLSPWITVEDVNVFVTLYGDSLSIVMLMTVQFVSMLVHWYSLSYMKDDPGVARYFSLLNLFVFSMTGLVLTDNALVMFVFWEGVGLCSYYLIGHWFSKSSASNAGMKAFIMNRIGDVGFVIALFIIFWHLHTFTIKDITENFVTLPHFWLVLAGGLFFLGATGKSAQIPLFVWLPDAMEGPTPVSALIHAATMVTAGIYMIARLFPLFLPVTEIILFIGVATAFVAACIAIEERDLKKILAYSTISQLGFMFAGLGAGFPDRALFHLVSHAFFKALLFLGAGSVMHATHGILDISRLGGLRKKMPITAMTTLIGAWALSGLPPLSGFFSKDPILESAFLSDHPLAGSFLIITSIITAYYSFKLVLLTFFGTPRDEKVFNHAHESGTIIRVVLIILSAGAIFLGAYWHFYPLLTSADFSGMTLESAHHMHWVMWVSILGAIIGFILAYFIYLRVEKHFDIFTAHGIRKILAAKFYVDEIYGAVILKPVFSLCNFSYKVFDLNFINAFYLNSARRINSLGQWMRLSRTGTIQSYFHVMIITILICLLFLTLWRFA